MTILSEAVSILSCLFLVMTCGFGRNHASGISDMPFQLEDPSAQLQANISDYIEQLDENIFKSCKQVDAEVNDMKQLVNNSISSERKNIYAVLSAAWKVLDLVEAKFYNTLNYALGPRLCGKYFSVREDVNKLANQATSRLRHCEFQIHSGPVSVKLSQLKEFIHELQDSFNQCTTNFTCLLSIQNSVKKTISAELEELEVVHNSTIVLFEHDLINMSRCMKNEFVSQMQKTQNITLKYVNCMQKALNLSDFNITSYVADPFVSSTQKILPFTIRPFIMPHNLISDPRDGKPSTAKPNTTTELVFGPATQYEIALQLIENIRKSVHEQPLKMLTVQSKFKKHKTYQTRFINSLINEQFRNNYIMKLELYFNFLETFDSERRNKQKIFCDDMHNLFINYADLIGEHMSQSLECGYKNLEVLVEKITDQSAKPSYDQKLEYCQYNITCLQFVQQQIELRPENVEFDLTVLFSDFEVFKKSTQTCVHSEDKKVEDILKRLESEYIDCVMSRTSTGTKEDVPLHDQLQQAAIKFNNSVAMHYLNLP